MKVLIVDKMSEKAVKALKDLGAEVVVNAVKAEDLPKALGDTEVLIEQAHDGDGATATDVNGFLAERRGECLGRGADKDVVRVDE